MTEQDQAYWEAVRVEVDRVNGIIEDLAGKTGSGPTQVAFRVLIMEVAVLRVQQAKLVENVLATTEVLDTVTDALSRAIETTDTVER